MGRYRLRPGSPADVGPMADLMAETVERNGVSRQRRRMSLVLPQALPNSLR